MGVFQKNVMWIVGAWSVYALLCAGAIYAWLAPGLVLIAIILTVSAASQLFFTGFKPYLVVVTENQIQIRSFFIEQRVAVEDIRHIDINVNQGAYGSKKRLRLTLKDCSEIYIHQLGGKPLAGMYQAISSRWRNTQVMDDSPLDLHARASLASRELLRRPPGWRSMLQPLSQQWRMREGPHSRSGFLPEVGARMRRPLSRPWSPMAFRRKFQPVYRSRRSRHSQLRRGRIREVLVAPTPKQVVVPHVTRRTSSEMYARWKRMNRIWNVLVVILTILVILFIVLMYRYRSTPHTGQAGDVFENMWDSKGIDIMR